MCMYVCDMYYLCVCSVWCYYTQLCPIYVTQHCMQQRCFVPRGSDVQSEGGAGLRSWVDFNGTIYLVLLMQQFWQVR